MSYLSNSMVLYPDRASLDTDVDREPVVSLHTSPFISSFGYWLDMQVFHLDSCPLGHGR